MAIAFLGACLPQQCPFLSDHFFEQLREAGLGDPVSKPFAAARQAPCRTSASPLSSLSKRLAGIEQALCRPSASRLPTTLQNRRPQSPIRHHTVSVASNLPIRSCVPPETRARTSRL